MSLSKIVALLIASAIALDIGVARADSESAGDATTVLLALGTVGSTYVFDDSDGRWMLAKSAAASLAANYSLKYAFNNSEFGRRPNGKGYGFPSGHAGVSAAAASFLNKRYGWQWGIPAWTAVGYISYVRVERTGHHRWRDIAAALAIAEASSWWFVQSRQQASLGVAPIGADGNAMVMLHLDF